MSSIAAWRGPSGKREVPPDAVKAEEAARERSRELAAGEP
jgi:hypothetical protein